MRVAIYKTPNVCCDECGMELYIEGAAIEIVPNRKSSIAHHPKNKKCRFDLATAKVEFSELFDIRFWVDEPLKIKRKEQT